MKMVSSQYFWFCSRTRPLQLVLAVVAATIMCRATAFSRLVPIHTSSFQRTKQQGQQQQHRTSGLVVVYNNKDPSESNPLDGMELTSALARIDQQWQIQQQRAPEQSRWTKLVLPRDDEEDSNNTDNIMENPPLKQSLREDDFVYLLEPSKSFSSSPSCLIVFVGGAGLGQFPQIAYSEFLKRVSDKLNAAILAAPYTVGLDHFELAKQTGDRLRRAILYCQDDPKRQYPESLPIFALSHSLGCKLQAIYVAATAQKYRGMGFISFNNFGFGQTIQMARTFAEELRGNYAGSFVDPTIMEKSNEAFNMIFGMAETILGAVGLDFSPNSKDTERIIGLKFNEELQRNARLFVFDQDNLDSSQQFVESCEGPGPSTSGLPGNHLTPVYFKLGLDELPEETREIAKEFTSGYESASFGDEGHMNELVDEVCNWILGKEPSRPAGWEATTRAETPRLTGVDKD